MSLSKRNASGPPISTMPFAGVATAVRVTAAATSAAAIGWISAVGRRTVSPWVASSAIAPTNSKNCVARTIEYGITDSSIRVSWATLARR
jgi:hypothetical protein